MNPFIAYALWSGIVWLIFKWRDLPQSLQIWAPRALLVAGLVCLVGALFLRGEYAQDIVLYIAGPNEYKVETISHSFAFLSAGIGVALLAVFALAQWGHLLPLASPLRKTFALTLAVVSSRIYLEKLGLPVDAVMFFGIIWLIVPFAVYFGVEAAKLGSQRPFWGWLFGYTFGTRIFIVIVMLVATYFELGTHFDNSSVTMASAWGNTMTFAPHSREQYLSLIIFPQLVLWSSATLLAGLIFGWPSYLIARRTKMRPEAKLPGIS